MKEGRHVAGRPRPRIYPGTHSAWLEKDPMWHRNRDGRNPREIEISAVEAKMRPGGTRIAAGSDFGLQKKHTMRLR